MAIVTPKQVPTRLTTGDTWAWERSISDYPASSYSAVWYFESAHGAFSVAAVASADKHTATVAAATTAGYAHGRWKWSLVVTKTADSTRTTIETGYAELLLNPAADGKADHRSHARKVLEAVEAVIEGRASTDQSAMAIGGRSLSRTPIADLLLLRDRYRAEVKREERAERIAAGLPAGGRVMVRF